MPISSLFHTGFPCLFGLFWKIMPISSIWKRDSSFLGLWWEPLENNANIFYLKTEFPCFFLGLWWEPHLKTGFPFFWACDGNLWKIMPISSIWKRDFPFLGLWWEPLENNANIFYLKTEFPCFFGLFWKIMPISSIWKRDFPFLGLWWEPLENNANIFYLKTGFPLFFLACDGNLWKIMPISSIWKRDFRCFFWMASGK